VFNFLSNHQSTILNPKSSMPPSPHSPPCNDVTRLAEKVATLEQWRQETDDYARIKKKVLSLETWHTATELDLKDIHGIISQVNLLMTLSIGGGGLSDDERCD
jgi:hypothetical protein